MESPAITEEGLSRRSKKTIKNTAVPILGLALGLVALVGLSVVALPKLPAKLGGISADQPLGPQGRDRETTPECVCRACRARRCSGPIPRRRLGHHRHPADQRGS